MTNRLILLTGLMALLTLAGCHHHGGRGGGYYGGDRGGSARSWNRGPGPAAAPRRRDHY